MISLGSGALHEPDRRRAAYASALHHLAQAPRLGERARLGDAREVVGHGDLVRLRGIAVDRLGLHAHSAALAVEAVVGLAPRAVRAHGMPDHHRDHLLPLPLVNLAPSGYSHTCGPGKRVRFSGTTRAEGGSNEIRTQP